MRSDYPYPPRFMTKDRAAHYCGVTKAAFDRAVATAELPLPVDWPTGGKELWSKTALDQALERLAGEGVNDWRGKSKLYATR